MKKNKETGCGRQYIAVAGDAIGWRPWCFIAIMLHFLFIIAYSSWHNAIEQLIWEKALLCMFV